MARPAKINHFKTPAGRLQIFRGAKEDLAWVSMIQVGPDGMPGHFDPYTGDRVTHATGYPDLSPRARSIARHPAGKSRRA